MVYLYLGVREDLSTADLDSSEDELEMLECVVGLDSLLIRPIWVA